MRCVIGHPIMLNNGFYSLTRFLQRPRLSGKRCQKGIEKGYDEVDKSRKFSYQTLAKESTLHKAVHVQFGL